MRYRRTKHIKDGHAILFFCLFILAGAMCVYSAIEAMLDSNLISLLILVPAMTSFTGASFPYIDFKKDNPLLFKTLKCGKCGRKIRPYNRLYFISQKDNPIWAHIPPPHWIFCEQCHSVEKLKE